MKKLTLNKEAIVKISYQEMNVVKGLTGSTCAAGACLTMVCPPPTYLNTCICN